MIIDMNLYIEKGLFLL